MPREETPVEITDLATLDLLNDPLRLRIISLLDEPRSVRDVAERLDVPVTRLYYHFNMMEEAGLIKIVETRKVGAMLQKLYEAAGTHYRPGKDLLSSIEDPRKFAEVATAVVLDGARLDAEEGMLAMFEEYGPNGFSDDVKQTIAIGRSVFNVPKHRIPRVRTAPRSARRGHPVRRRSRRRRRALFIHLSHVPRGGNLLGARMTETAPTTEEQPTPGLRDLLRIRNFRYLWLGQIVSDFGDNLTYLSLLLLVNRLTGSTVALAGLAICPWP